MDAIAFAFRDAALAAGFPKQTAVLTDIDRLLGSGITPTERLQAAFPYGTHGWFALLMVEMHTSWFYVPGALTLYVILWRWDDIVSYAVARSGILFVAVLFFVLVPAAPPWMALPVTRVIEHSPLGRTTPDPNPFAAFPSLHVAVPAVQAMWLWSKRMRRLAYVFAAYTLLTIFMSVYTGEHYLVDAIGGLALAYVMVRLSALPRVRRWRIGAARDGAPEPGAVQREAQAV
ncbi:MAG: inositol phosphorylceramide synthase [Dehalococcoidia bacterium]|nr:inositol phosphorylceramide synthase [Dehalococcoidia bacterium]